MSKNSKVFNKVNNEVLGDAEKFFSTLTTLALLGIVSNQEINELFTKYKQI